MLINFKLRVKSMGERGFLGMDESNHGRFPEIFVAVYSRDPSMVNRRTLAKWDGKRAQSPLLRRGEYSHIIVPDYYGRILQSDMNIRLMVVAEFIRHFNDVYGDLELVVIDGTPLEGEHQRLKELARPYSLPRIVHEPKADVTFPIVNEADRIAHVLFRYYRDTPHHELSKKYLKTLITPRVEDYMTLVITNDRE